MAVAVRAMTAVDRARLFVEGRQDDLLKSMGKQQRVCVSYSELISALLTVYVAPCRRGCINFGSSPLKQQSIGAADLTIGLLAYLASMTTDNG